MNTSGAAFDSFNVAAERQIGRYGDKPFITWYADRRDERVELSFKTFDNWVAKTANLLVDELGVEPGDRVGAVMVDHWQAPVVLAACWRAGARVVALDPGPDPSPPPGGLVAAFVPEEHLATVGAALAETDGTMVVALTADLLGRSQHDLGKALNFTRVVPSMGDVFAGGPDPDGQALTIAAGPGGHAGAQDGSGPGPAGTSEGSDPGPAGTLDGSDPGPAGGFEGSDPRPAGAATMAELLGRAAGLAARTGLNDGDRMLSALPLLSLAGAVAGLLAPFTTGAGVVLARDVQPARFWKRVADERVAVAVLDPDQAGSLLAAGPPPAGLDHSRLRVLACQGAGEALRAGFPPTFGVPLLDD
ncbi:MAG TPA: TIGR03089 family protein [Actinomycetes bacterium]|nr:TIGR03089 family protein [Actinomycetes bacterium]